MQQGLFDFATPEMVDLQVEQENQAYANRAGSMLDKIAGAGSLAALRGSSILGDALGQPDPRKAQAMKVQEALQEIKQSGVDLNEDPVGFYKAMAKAFASKGLMQQATQASMKAMEAEEKKEDRQLKRDIGANRLEESRLQVAEANAKLMKAMQTAQGKPWQDQVIELAKTGKYKPETLQKFAETGNFSDLDTIEKPTKTDHGAGPASVDAGGRVYVRVSPEEFEATNPKARHPTLKNYIDAGAAPERGTKVSVGMPGPDYKQLRYGTQVINDGNQVKRKFDETILDIDKAAALLKQNSPAAEKMAIPLMIRAVQTGNIARRDIEEMANTGDLPTRVANAMLSFFDGTPSNATQEDRLAALKNMRKLIVKKRNEELIPFRKLAQDANANPDDLWKLMPEEEPKGKPMKLPSGKTIYVE